MMNLMVAMIRCVCWFSCTFCCIGAPKMYMHMVHTRKKQFESYGKPKEQKKKA